MAREGAFSKMLEFWTTLQSGAYKNGMAGIPVLLGAWNTNHILRQLDLDMTIPNSLI